MDILQDSASWNELFWRHSKGVPTDDVTPALRAGLSAALLAHPKFDVPPEAFIQHLAERVQAQGDEALSDAVGLIRHADLYLALAALRGHPDALQELQQLVYVQTDQAVRKMRHAAHNLSELQQAVLTRVIFAEERARPRLAEYEGRGPLQTWLRALAVRTVLNAQRGKREVLVQPDACHIWPDDNAADPDVQVLRTRFRSDFAAAFEASFSDLDVEERNLLRLHLLDGLTLDQLAVVSNAHRATVGRRIQRIKERLVSGTKRRLSHQLRASKEEVEELISLVRSQLDVSIQRMLLHLQKDSE